MYKLTNKVKVEELKNMLNANAKAIKAKDKNLFDQLVYAGKNPDKATRADLMSLAKQAITLLGEKFVVPAMAEETHFVTPVPEAEKPAGKKLKAKEETKEVKSEQALKPKKADKKEAEKPKTAKEEPKVTPKEVTGKKSTRILAEMFPETLEIEGETYDLADIKDMKSLHKSLTDGADLVLAFYWTKRHLKQFPYYQGLLGQPESFKDDLDLANIIYISDEFKVAYSVSLYTEAYYSIFPKDLEVVDGLRFANGMEFQIYIKK